jgi:hypothetical protein
MIRKSCGIESRVLWNLNKSYGIQLRQSRLFFLGQRNLLVFDWDFLLWLIKCLLLFNITENPMDSSIKRILGDFLLKNTHTNNHTETLITFSSSTWMSISLLWLICINRSIRSNPLFTLISFPQECDSPISSFSTSHS